MINIIVGALALLFGLWGMFSNWWETVEFARTVFPMILAAYGVVALIAGLRRISGKIPDND